MLLRVGTCLIELHFLTSRLEYSKFCNYTINTRTINLQYNTTTHYINTHPDFFVRLTGVCASLHASMNTSFSPVCVSEEHSK